MSLQTLQQDYPTTSKTDGYLLALAVIFVFFGLIMILSSSTVLGLRVYHDSFYFVKRHLFFMSLGAVSFVGGIAVPHQFWRKYAFQIWLASLFLVGLTYIPHIGSTAGGSTRWLSFAGLRFQPSDMLKFSLFLFLAHLLDTHKDRLQETKQVLAVVVVIILISIAPVLKQPDLGTSIVLGSVSFGILFVSGLPMTFLAALASAGVGGIALSILFTPYQLKRFLAFSDPWKDPLGKGFHVIQSLIAVGSGGLLGMGIGGSRQKFFYLPQQYTDYIFSIIAEEFGFIWTSLFIIIFLSFIFKGFLVISRTPNLYSKLLGLGIILWIGIQSLMNIGVTLNLIPSKGITLPFISFGGTSLVMILFATGVLINISRYQIAPK